MYNYKSVIAILNMRSKLIDWSLEEERIKQICAWGSLQCANRDYMKDVDNEKLPVVNGLLEFPRRLIILKRVKALDGQPINYRQEANYIKPRHIIQGYVLLDYTAIPEDDEGLPPIMEYQLSYMVALCRRTLMEDMYFEDKIREGQWQKLVEDEAGAFRKANKGRPSIDKMSKALWMMRHGIYHEPSAIGNNYGSPR